MNTFFTKTKYLALALVAGATLAIPSVLFAQVASNDGSFTVTTQPASSVSATNATLNGYAAQNTTDSSAKVTIWFEWGTTSTPDNTTYSKVGWEKSSASIMIDGLAKGTRYYYRAVGIADGNTAYGATLSFVTSGGAIATTGTTQTTDQTGTVSGQTTQTSGGTTSGVGSSNTSTNKTSTVTKNTTVATTETKSTTGNVGTMSALITTQGASAGATTETTSSGGIGALILWLVIVAVILAIIAGFVHVAAVREEMRQKDQQQANASQGQRTILA